MSVTPMPGAEAPAVSVIMGVLSRAEDTLALERAVESILGQSFTDWEFLICPTGSGPRTMAFLGELARREPRVRIVYCSEDNTLSAKLNACLHLARGRFIARMDDDDQSLPERLERQLAYLTAHEEIAFVGSNVELVRGGQRAGEWHFPARPEVRDFYNRQPFVHPAIVFRREALEAVNGYGQEPRCLKCEDYDLLLRLYEKGYRGANLPQVLFRYTIPETAAGSRTMADRAREARTRWVRFAALGRLPGALPYVIKPLAVGLLPEKVLRRIKEREIHV